MVNTNLSNIQLACLVLYLEYKWFLIYQQNLSNNPQPGVKLCLTKPAICKPSGCQIVKNKAFIHKRQKKKTQKKTRKHVIDVSHEKVYRFCK